MFYEKGLRIFRLDAVAVLNVFRINYQIVLFCGLDKHTGVFSVSMTFLRAEYPLINQDLRKPSNDTDYSQAHNPIHPPVSSAPRAFPASRLLSSLPWLMLVKRKLLLLSTVAVNMAIELGRAGERILVCIAGWLV